MMGMISRNSAEVFGYVPKDLKRRMAAIRKQDTMWSESRMIKEALLRFVPLLEGQVSPTRERSHRANAV
jgi:hypothetical protein